MEDVYEKRFVFFLLSLVGGLIAALGIHKDGKHKEIRGRAMGKHTANYMKLMKCQKKIIIKKKCQARSGTQVEGAVKPAARRIKKIIREKGGTESSVWETQHDDIAATLLIKKLTLGCNFFPFLFVYPWTRRRKELRAFLGRNKWTDNLVCLGQGYLVPTARNMRLRGRAGFQGIGQRVLFGGGRPLRRNSHQRKKQPKKDWSRHPPSWRLGFTKGTVCLWYSTVQGFAILASLFSQSLYLSLHVPVFLTGDKGRVLGDDGKRRMRFGSVKSGCVLGETGGEERAKEKKGSDLHHDGPCGDGAVPFDMCRSWVGWAAVAGVGQGPLEMM